MTELSHDARMLVEQGRSSDAPNAGDRARIRGRLVGELGAGAFATAAVTSVALSAGQASVVVSGAAASAVVSGAAVSAVVSGAAASAVVSGAAVSAVVSGAAVSAATGATNAVQRATHAGSAWLKVAAAMVAVGGGALLYVASVSPAPQVAPRTAQAPGSFAVQREALPSSDEPRTAAAAAVTQAQREAAAQMASDTAQDSAAETRAEARSAVQGAKSEAHPSSAVARGRSKRSRSFAESSDGELPSAERAGAASAGTAVEKIEESTVSAELELLARAQRALREGEARAALTLSAEHAAKFSKSAFAEERAGIETLARCMLGERRAANARAFLERAPSSPLAARVRKECGVE